MKINRVGEIGYNHYGTKLQIVEYNNNKDIKVKICDKDEIIINTDYKCFKQGNIKSAYDKTVCNIGYIGEIKYTDISIKDLKSYKYWSEMIKRCYSDKSLLKRPRYKEVTVCEEWHNFTNFKKWFDNNYYEVFGENMDLDKDLIEKNNKVYCPKKCIFVPHRINSLIISCNSRRGEYPIGVTTNTNGSIVAKCSILQPNGKSKSKSLGTFNTPEEAFNAYKTFKEQYIKEVADEYKLYIPHKLYEAMYRYVVSIED